MSERTGREDIARRYDTLMLTQAEIDSRLRLSEQIKSVPCPIVDRVLTPPKDYLELIAMYDAFGEPVVQFSQLVPRPLYEWEEGRFVFGEAQHTGRSYDSVTFRYYSKLPRLDNDNDTNVALDRYFGIYFSGMTHQVLMEAEDYDAAKAYYEIFSKNLEDAQYDSVKRGMDFNNLQDFGSDQQPL